MKIKLSLRNLVVAVGFFAIAAIFAFLLAKRQYVPPALTTTATRFLSSIREANFEDAIKVTHPGVAASTQELEKKIRDQIGDPARIEDFEINFVYPKQTYGNRIRRWSQRRELDLVQESVDFTLIGHGGSLVALFEVRLRRTTDGEWRVVYFQSHAG